MREKKERNKKIGINKMNWNRYVQQKIKKKKLIRAKRNMMEIVKNVLIDGKDMIVIKW